MENAECRMGDGKCETQTVGTGGLDCPRSETACPYSLCHILSFALIKLNLIHHCVVPLSRLRARAPRGLTVHRTVIQYPRFRFDQTQPHPPQAVPLPQRGRLKESIGFASLPKGEG